MPDSRVPDSGELRTADGRRRPGERGATLAEVTTVIGLMALIAVPLVFALQSAARLERTQTARLDGEAQLDRLTSRLTDDIRAGRPSPADLRRTSPDQALALRVPDGAGSELVVIWEIDGGRVTRTVETVSGVEQSSAALVDDAPNGLVVHYRDPDGQSIGPDDTDRVANCGALVEVVVEIGDPVVADRTIAAAHRERPNGDAPC